jgi:hypothetical protein
MFANLLGFIALLRELSPNNEKIGLLMMKFFGGLILLFLVGQVMGLILEKVFHMKNY